MASRKAPICENCGNPVKEVICVLPAVDRRSDQDVIYAGCIMDFPAKKWDCLCWIDEPEHKVDLQIVVGDITDLEVDAIVNAANPELQRGGGVCGAIFAAAGPGLAEEIANKYPDGIETGEAVITGGYASKAKWIVHAVAPQATHQGSGDHAMLAMAYRNSLLLADAAGAKSIAFPSLGTRVSGWEVRKAAGHALHNGIFSLLLQLSSIESVTLCCFCEHDADDYRVGRERLLYDEGMLETLGEG